MELQALSCFAASGLVANLLVLADLFPRTAADLLFVLLVSLACHATRIVLK